MALSESSMIAIVVLVLAMILSQAAAVYKPTSSGGPLMHTMTKKSFQDMKCKGMYEKTLFSKLEGVCEGCHRLYQDLDIPTLCRSRCFNNPYFFSCLDALLMKDEQENYENMIEYIGGWKRK
ncbi:unnamed protein product [Notodromas monacha]|uniref:Uncharacterized protein n=1 Tax=Notodromas monacha TaxID=399045 RepID=A0A7R9BR29_9CRUS|nr:unnamed protein product [Notodromas monacha]CAG0918613.1 unnamed protein product [Notodromas monacha]